MAPAPPPTTAAGLPYACSTSTDAVVWKSFDASRSPIGPSSGDSVQSAIPAVRADPPGTFPTTKRSLFPIASTFCISPTISFALKTPRSLYSTVAPPPSFALSRKSRRHPSSAFLSFSASNSLAVKLPPFWTNRSMVRSMVGFLTMRVASAATSRSSLPPKKSATTRYPPPGTAARPRSTRMPTVHGEKLCTLQLSDCIAGWDTSSPPSTDRCLWNGSRMSAECWRTTTARRR
uniref:Uncharacterized protein n=1 Tax=Oryza punctata TaxID=4537 RepID=A0A0E0MBV4_ORYPU